MIRAEEHITRAIELFELDITRSYKHHYEKYDEFSQSSIPFII